MSDTTEIWNELHRLHRERSEEIGRRMKDYDVEHHAKLKALRERCKALGHAQGRWHDNGVGTSFNLCQSCGGVIETYSD